MRAASVLKAMLMGLPVEIGGNSYVMGEEGEFAVKMQQYSTDDPENVNDVYMKLDYTLGDFYQLCQDMTEEEYAVVVSNVVINTKGILT